MTSGSVNRSPGRWPAVIGGVTLAAVLADRRLEAILYRNLSILRTDIPIPHTLEDLAWRGAHRERLAALCDLIGDDGVLERIPRWAEDAS